MASYQVGNPLTELIEGSYEGSGRYEVYIGILKGYPPENYPIGGFFNLAPLTCYMSPTGSHQGKRGVTKDWRVLHPHDLRMVTLAPLHFVFQASTSFYMS